ncbi:MAG: hypothetical protein V1770_02745 [bacterium]
MKEKYRDYIKSPQHWKDMFNGFVCWQSKDKVPIKKIKINRKLFDFDNAVNMEDVYYRLMNFSKELWMPITVNKDYYLLDGQHRLKLAGMLGLNYIDVVIEDEDKIVGTFAFELEQ